MFLSEIPFNQYEITLCVCVHILLQEPNNESVELISRRQWIVISWKREFNMLVNQLNSVEMFAVVYNYEHELAQ